MKQQATLSRNIRIVEGKIISETVQGDKELEMTKDEATGQYLIQLPVLSSIKHVTVEYDEASAILFFKLPNETLTY